MPIVGPSDYDFTVPSDAELVVVDYLRSRLPDVYEVGLVVPEVDVLRTRVPFTRVTRRSGTGVLLDRFDYPSFDIDVFHGTNALVNTAAAVVRGALHDITSRTPYRHVGEDVIITRVIEAVGPQRLPWEDPDIVRIGMSFDLTVRSSASPLG